MNDHLPPVLQVRIGLLLVGALLFGYGVRADLGGYRFAGMALFAVALVLRWWKPRRSDTADSNGRPND